MNCGELIAFLQKNQQHLKKSLSQNFLIDNNITNKILSSASIQNNDTVLEIGPGAGILTKKLLTSKAKVFAVEKDPFFAEKLSHLKGNLSIYSADILNFPLHFLPPKTKVVANLPYNITTPILTHLFSHYHLFSYIVVMVQKEVALRMTAKPHSKQWSRLSLYTQFYSDSTLAFTVSKNCFFPKPNVESAVVLLKIKKPALENPLPFFQFLKTAFEKRRKMLPVSLQDKFSKEKIRQALTELKIPTFSRPENLSLIQWLDFYHQLIETTSR